MILLTRLTPKVDVGNIKFAMMEIIWRTAKNDI